MWGMDIRAAGDVYSTRDGDFNITLATRKDGISEA
jgi:hypothetical protein